MEGPISFWGYKEQESNLILPKHDDDEEYIMMHGPLNVKFVKIVLKQNQKKKTG